MKIKSLILTLAAVGCLGLVTGCAADKTPYEQNNDENYTVSVKYDANGGSYTTNTTVIVDSYNIADLKANSEGKVEIPLITPDDTNRGNDAFTPTKSGYFLAGWYAERTETLDADGNTTYVYGKKWDFSKDKLAVEADKTYSADAPVLTLYAAWVPMFKVEFYSLADGTLLETYDLDPTQGTELNVPDWNEKTGAMDMFKFPSKVGYTFDGVYLDSEGKTAVTGETIAHTGYVDYTNGQAKDATMKLYVDYREGEWYQISNIDQFLDNASINGSYEILCDLDFADAFWPTALTYGNYNGTIKGNGHTFRNISVEQTNNSKVNAGLFGVLAENASVSDLTFENVTFTIKSGTRMAGTSFGLFAGTISEAATVSNVKILSSCLKVDSKCYFGVDDYSIGLVCGMGNASLIPDAQISCEATGDAPENVKITVNGNDVDIEIVTP